MTIKQIVAAVEYRSDPDPVTRTGFTLAKRFGASLVLVYVIPMEDGPRYSGGLTLHAVMDEIAREQDAEAEIVRRRFEDAARRHAVRSEWRSARGYPDDEVVLHSRYSDIAIIPQTDPDPPRFRAHLHADSVVLNAGRPVIVVPRERTRSGLKKRVLVAWNASREATRAINDALPILEAADMVDVAVVNPGNGHEGMGGHGEEPGADIASHLARHGIHAEVHLEHTADEGVGSRLAQLGEEIGAALIVAGAYGYSPTHEFVTCGVTRHLLRNARVPVLFSR